MNSSTRPNTTRHNDRDAAENDLSPFSQPRSATTANPADALLSIQDVATQLGATAVAPAWPQPDTSDAGLTQLANNLTDRLKSTGGRPTDPAWTLTRRVPFAPETWQSLQSLAERLGHEGRTIAPAQLAATFVEERVAQLDAAIRTHHTGKAPGPTGPG